MSPSNNNSTIKLSPLVINEPSCGTPCEILDDMLFEQDTILEKGMTNSAASSFRFTSANGSVHVSNTQVDTQETAVTREESSKSIKAKYQKIEKTTVELQEVARTIMERYISEGAQCEINIPQKMRIATQQIFQDWVNSHLSNGGTPTGMSALNNVDPLLGGTRTTSTKDGDIGGSAKIKKHMNTPFFQLDFCDMFHEPKQEILRMLKGDLFMRWKKTKEFQFFITNLKPYEEMSLHSNPSRSSLVSDLNKNDGNGSQQSSLRRIVNATGGVSSRENSLRGVLKNLSMR